MGIGLALCVEGWAGIARLISKVIQDTARDETDARSVAQRAARIVAELVFGADARDAEEHAQLVEMRQRWTVQKKTYSLRLEANNLSVGPQAAKHRLEKLLHGTDQALEEGAFGLGLRQFFKGITSYGSCLQPCYF